jgi:hypothetical protein
MSYKKRSGSKRSDEQLRKASDSLIYEIWMFRGLAKDIEGKLSSGLGVVSNAVLDSFLIHTRALLNFLYTPKNPHKNDVLAEHYFLASEEWLKIRPEKSEFLDNVQTRINTSVAHISYVRRKSSWELSKIVEEIDVVINHFLSIVPRHLLGSRWNEFKRVNGNDGEITLPLPPYREGCAWEREGIPSSFYGVVTQIETDCYPDDQD